MYCHKVAGARVYRLLMIAEINNRYTTVTIIGIENARLLPLLGYGGQM